MTLAQDLPQPGSVGQVSNKPIRLWLDAIRPAPDGWVHVFSVNGAKEVLASCPVSMGSLNYDLGVHAGNGGDGALLVDWMAQRGAWPREGIRVHALNPRGLQFMLRTIDLHSPYGPGEGTSRGSFSI